ncbi:MAG: hypothetical protein ACXACU_12260 [Candidatus Hodarchaeales archaeon]|jgi:hypothetical protein
MTIFEDARREWNTLTSKTSWAAPVFGETYHMRYPVESGTAEAITYKRSVFKGDDSVHEWDASGIRKTIIQRIIASQERIIRPWYGELSFFSEQTKLLPPMPESELDFILRTSLQSTQDSDSEIFGETRNNLLNNLDPSLTEEEKEEQKSSYITSVFMGKPEDRAKMYGKCLIELYGILNVIKDKMIVGAINDEEISAIIDLVLDIERSELIFVKRFIEPNMREEDMKPFIGQGNSEVKLTTNFLAKYIGGGDADFYKYRILQLWVRNILDFDKQVVEYIENEKSHLLSHFLDETKIKQVLYTGIKLYRWHSRYQRLLTLFRTDYATKLDFKGFASEIIHLITGRNELFQDFKEGEDILFFPIDFAKFDPTRICFDLGVEMIESIITYLANQIPEPEGTNRSQMRLVMRKRINNMRKFVLIDELRDDILEIISNIHQFVGTEEDTILKVIREPYDRLVPSTDDPQTLAKQYGNKAETMVGRNAEISELYTTILGLKSSEIMFSGSMQLTPLKQRRITQSVIDDIVHPQFKFLDILTRGLKGDDLEE